MSSDINNFNSHASEIMKSVAEHSEKVIIEQLNDFISRGLLELRSVGPTLVHALDSNKIEIKYGCMLILKDKEYILKLEEENKEMKELLKQLGKFSETQKT